MTRQARVPFVDLAVSNQAALADLEQAFQRVVAGSAFIGGIEVAAFEEQLADFLGSGEVVGVASGTAALFLALSAAGVGPGDEVILPANTFFATAEAIWATGATAVLVDVDGSTALMDPILAEAAIGPRTTAIIGVHLYGQPVDADRFGALAEHSGLFFLEDAAQAVGSSWQGRPTGTLADAAGFSFYPTKNLGALGDAGAVSTADPALARRIRALRSHGEEQRHVHAYRAWNERLDGLQAAFLSVKLRRLPEDQRARDDAAAVYRSRLGAVPGVTLFETDQRARNVHHLMVVQVDHRDKVLAALRRQGVDAAVHYPTPLHLQPAGANLGKPGQFPVAESLAQRILSLPLFAGISIEQIDRTLHALTVAMEAA